MISVFRFSAKALGSPEDPLSGRDISFFFGELKGRERQNNYKGYIYSSSVAPSSHRSTLALRLVLITRPLHGRSWGRQDILKPKPDFFFPPFFFKKKGLYVSI